MGRLAQPYLNHSTDPNTTQTLGERYGDDRKSTPSTHFIKIKLYRNKQEQAAAELGKAQRLVDRVGNQMWINIVYMVLF